MYDTNFLIVILSHNMQMHYNMLHVYHNEQAEAIIQNSPHTSWRQGCISSSRMQIMSSNEKGPFLCLDQSPHYYSAKWEYTAAALPYLSSLVPFTAQCMSCVSELEGGR